MVYAEPFACAPETAHHLIHHEQHSVAVTNLAQAIEINGRRLHDTARPAVTFDENGRTVLRTFADDYVLDHLRNDFVAFFLSAVTIDWIAIRIRVWRADNPGD